LQRRSAVDAVAIRNVIIGILKIPVICTLIPRRAGGQQLRQIRGIRRGNLDIIGVPRRAIAADCSDRRH